MRKLYLNCLSLITKKQPNENRKKQIISHHWLHQQSIYFTPKNTKFNIVSFLGQNKNKEKCTCDQDAFIKISTKFL